MSNIIQLNPIDSTTNDLNAVVNTLENITRRSKQVIDSINMKLKNCCSSPIEQKFLFKELNNEIKKWSDKVKKLGGNPVKMYEVELDNFYWKYN